MSMGLVELNISRNGITSRLGTGGIDISGVLYDLVTWGVEALKVNNENKIFQRLENDEINIDENYIQILGKLHEIADNFEVDEIKMYISNDEGSLIAYYGSEVTTKLPPESVDFTLVQAPADGIVDIRLYASISEYGNYIIIQHEDGRFSVLAHLEKATVENRSHVRQGDAIAIAGGTGTIPNMDPHVHWSVFEGVSSVHSMTDNTGIFLGPGWLVNIEKAINPLPLVNSGAYIHPSQGFITSPFGARPNMAPPRNFHEGIDYSLWRGRE